MNNDEQMLTFGTAGIRGIVGTGAGKMNDEAVARATQGFCDYLRSGGNGKSIVIAYDSRRDSRRFAEIAASVAAGNGFAAYIYDGVRSTPQLSFSVRELRCAGGVMITASHNPPEYNGYKVYGPDGCQLLPQESDKVAENFMTLQKINAADFLPKGPATLAECIDADSLCAANAARGGIFYVPAELDAMYIEAVLRVSLRPQLLPLAGICAAYTPLHGVGGETVRRLFAKAGYSKVLYVESQMKPDGEFPTIRTPNPEAAAAFDEAQKYSAAELMIATDPDCDRMGIMLRGGKLLTGNEAAALFLSYVLSAKKERGELKNGDYIVSTVVSGDLPKAVAQSYGVRYIQVLTGFKYIGRQIEQDPEHFLMGFEESCGYLFSAEVRDKDGCMASLLAVEMAAYFEGGIGAELERLYKKHGVYLDVTDNYVYSNPADIAERMSRVRACVLPDADRITDYLTDCTGLPETDLVKFELCGGGWIAFRPSGTEPKLKVYYCMRGLNSGQAHERLEKYRGIIENLFK